MLTLPEPVGLLPSLPTRLVPSVQVRDSTRHCAVVLDDQNVGDILTTAKDYGVQAHLSCRLRDPKALGRCTPAGRSPSVEVMVPRDPNARTDEAVVMINDQAQTIVVLAKEPRPGRVKTRLQARFSPEQAAALAAAALSDTLAAVRTSRVRRRVLAWEGDPTGWNRGFEVVVQPDGDLGARLASAFSNVQTTRPGEPTLLIGMDPPVEPSLLEQRWWGRRSARAE